MNLEESLRKLYSLHQFGVKLGLEKTRHLLKYIDNPQNKLKCIHIAGSNAKGSVASFIASILQEDGNNVGLYTSPHFIKFNERIRINGEMLPDEFVIDFMNDLNNYINKYEPTFFELTTAMAFKYFAEKDVDYAVIETGLGGRLDATNVIEPVASVITTISLEHTNILGNTIEEIAREKCEIIKQSGKAVTGYLNNEAKAVIKSRVREVGTELFEIDKYTTIEEGFIELQYGSFNCKIYSTPLGGKYQRKNAALAVLALLCTIELKSLSSLFRGINNVVSNSGIQGRYEIYNENPRVIFDSSHNPEGIENFISEFQSERNNYDKREIIFGVKNDKDIAGMLKKFDDNFDKIYITTFDYEKAAKIEEVKKIGDEIGVTLEANYNVVRYISQFIEKGKNECLVVLGSIYLLGEIKRKLMYNLT